MRGYSIGVRLIEDFLAKTGSGRCRDFRETMDVVSKVGEQVTKALTPGRVSHVS